MSGTKLNTYAVGNEDITAVMDTLNKVSLGFHSASLTEWATTTIPQIAAGATVECAGAIFEFLTAEAIGGTAVNGTNYIKLIPAGSSITAEWTQTAPVWNTEYNGWYSPTGGEETYRYLEFYCIKSTSIYLKYKFGIFPNLPSQAEYILPSPEWEIVNVSANFSKTITVFKPCVAWIGLTTVGQDSYGHITFSYYQNGEYHVTVSGTQSEGVGDEFFGNLHLLPGIYQLVATGSVYAVNYLMKISSIWGISDISNDQLKALVLTVV